MAVAKALFSSRNLTRQSGFFLQSADYVAGPRIIAKSNNVGQFIELTHM